MNPLIGVIANIDLNRYDMPATVVPLAYTTSLEKAGGQPLIFPLTLDETFLPVMADAVKGFLFIGGNDIDPGFYNEMPEKELGKVDKTLDMFQMAALKIAMAREKPVLGICRGIQIVNVALGGTLFQDIPSQFDPPVLNHMQDTISFETDHEVDIEPGSELHDLFGSHIRVNSRHHQSIKTLGKDLIITARAPDGVIEAVRHKTLPMELVQWHPELMMQKNNDMLPLFKMFVEKCRLR
ncbi:MAG: hypothetical protein A2277_01845 [Desulfobacterales bacterium RIFOXYA12_FULL_46_15]|nr:MAG: hypothetical protein A2097_09375 [Desulfobacula sp. GWF2_41_7]OGR27267.1 MAG: hypothetical protein A2277_01845 [Desulfobacterales bacterium RIFOXYA12_FULL_46_15]